MTLHSTRFPTKMKDLLMKKVLSLLFVSLVLVAGHSAFAKTDDPSANAKLRLPWEVLQDVLNLDSKSVRLAWDEFRTLLRLTSSKKFPEFTMAGGDVVLSRDEFTRLVQSLVLPAPPVAEAAVSKASYHGRLVDSSAVFTAFLRVEIPRRPTKPLRIDLFPGSVAFQSIQINGKPALAQVENGRLFITVSDPGSHKIEIHFSVPMPESAASQSLTIPIARTPLTEWILDIPEKNLDITVNRALNREVSNTEKGTRIRALLSPSDHVTVAWNPLAPDIAKGPAQIYADVDHLISVQDDALRIQSRVGIEVLQNTINSLTLAVSDGFTVLDVQGDSVKEWQENEGKPTTLTIPLRTARKGRMNFQVVLERVLSSEKSTTRFTGITVQNAVRQRGHIGVELNSDAELPAPGTQNLEPKDPFRELPPTLSGQSARLVFGYKYLRPSFSLDLALSRHESVNVVPSVIDRAEGTSVLRPDGKNVHRITYYLRSSAQQFLPVTLPEGTQLWNTFVDGAPVKPVHGDGRKTFIPLVRSLRADNTAFPVELVYYQKNPRLSFFGREDLPLPMPDVLVSRLQWTVVTPPDQKFFYLGNEFEKWEPPSMDDRRFNKNKEERKGTGGGFMADKKARQEENRKIDERSDNLGMDQLKQADAEGSEIDQALASAPPSVMLKALGQAAGMSLRTETTMTAGVLPVRVNVPSTGNSVTYTKTLPDPNTLLILPLYHGAVWLKTLGWAIAWGAFGFMGWTIRWAYKRKRFEGAKS